MVRARPRLSARIFLLSAFVLFLELVVVRWLGTEVGVFAFVQNGVLVASLLGLGIGCHMSRRGVRLARGIAALLAAAAFVRDPLDLGFAEAVTQGVFAFQSPQMWTQSVGGALAVPWVRLSVVCFAFAATLGLLAAVAHAFVPLGQWLGRWMDEEPRPIAAYSANILGSLAGIAVFDLATLTRTPPLAWMLACAAGFVTLGFVTEKSGPRRTAVAALGLGLPLLFTPTSPFETVWSPYQKLTIGPLRVHGRVCGEGIDVNNSYYQILADLDPAHMAAEPDLYPPDQIRTSHYMLPHEIVGSRRRVLVVGAGAGNDVAAALRHGAERVDAVEIDPVIAEWGRERHPARPYADSRVRVVNDDARAFFRRHEGPYDLVVFGLLDSHTNLSAYTHVRLDHFVYTRESFADVKRLVAPGGVVVLFFEVQNDWLADRLATLAAGTFGARPLAFLVRSSSPCLGYGGFMLVAGEEASLAPIRSRVHADTALEARLWPEAKLPLRTRTPTDDWPYLYLERPGIPAYHLVVGAIVLALGLSFRRLLLGSGASSDLTMLLLGAGFMLLEVSGVSRAALLFGTTWTVNAYVIGAILSMILLANLTASRVRYDPAGWPFVGLAGSLVALGLVPTAWFAPLPLAARVCVGGAFVALPVFFSGLVFVAVWAATPRRDLALGSNILGSLVGGVLSLLSMAVGFRRLTFLTLCLYLGALLAIRRGRVGPTVA
jgi:spermidine synthase